MIFDQIKQTDESLFIDFVREYRAGGEISNKCESLFVRRTEIATKNKLLITVCFQGTEEIYISSEIIIWLSVGGVISIRIIGGSLVMAYHELIDIEYLSCVPVVFE